eukprot:3652399-Karenia_brevis.AAC.1
MLRRFYIDNKKFIIPNGKGFTLGTCRTVPKSAEPLQMLQDMNEKYTQDKFARSFCYLTCEVASRLPAEKK